MTFQFSALPTHVIIYLTLIPRGVRLSQVSAPHAVTGEGSVCEGPDQYKVQSNDILEASDRILDFRGVAEGYRMGY